MRTTREAPKPCGSPVRIREIASIPPADATRAMIGWWRRLPVAMSDTAITQGYWKRLGALGHDGRSGSDGRCAPDPARPSSAPPGVGHAVGRSVEGTLVTDR